MFSKIRILKDFAKYTVKQLCWSHFLINLQALQSLALRVSEFLILETQCLYLHSSEEMHIKPG